MQAGARAAFRYVAGVYDRSSGQVSALTITQHDEPKYHTNIFLDGPKPAIPLDEMTFRFCRVAALSDRRQVLSHAPRKYTFDGRLIGEEVDKMTKK